MMNCRCATLSSRQDGQDLQVLILLVNPVWNLITGFDFAFGKIPPHSSAVKSKISLWFSVSNKLKMFFFNDEL